jgi:membrane protease subunit HflK
MASASPGSGSYRGIVFALLGASALGAALVAIAGSMLGNPAMLDTAVSLGLATGVLAGVAATLRRRARSARAGVEPFPQLAPAQVGEQGPILWRGPLLRAWRHATTPQGVVAILGVVATLLALHRNGASSPQSVPRAVAAVALSLAGAGLAATAARYLADVEPARLPEAPGLARGGRLLAWVLVLAALAVGLAACGAPGGVRFLHVLVLALNLLVCVELFVVAQPADVTAFPTDLKVFSALGSRANPLASVGNAAQRQLGIDLRSTWALDIVRRSAEPIVVALCVLGWLSTAVTVVGVEEQGLVERFGVPRDGPPLGPGLHVHWPLPIDRVVRVPVQRVQVVHVGHEGEEEGGPENVLWARQHGKAEYTLLLGDGRDLIAVDAAVQFRVSDAYAWLYKTRNSVDALRAIAYRAVMKATVGLTLAEALSENVAALTAGMRGMVQADADALGLGIQVMAFTVGGMHPPVGVAGDYQAVVSAALRKTTVAIDARAERNEIVPVAQAEVVASNNVALADTAVALGRATGEAASFLALEAAFRAAPAEYRFRRRLEALESGLQGVRFTVLDARIPRDGGELWLMK